MSYTTILKGIAQANKVKIADLTKKMIQNAPIPVRYKKFLQGQTLGEARMAKSLKSHRGVVPMELKALGIGLAAGNAATKLVDAMWSTRPTGLDDKLKKRSNTITAADRKSAMEKQAARKRANRDLEQAKDKRLKGDVENATAPKPKVKPKAKEKLVAMKDQGKGGKPGDGSTAVKKSLRPKARPFKDGGMAKKKPAAKKMMGGGMAKTGYMYGGMAKKKAKK
jgi:hypothetical protein